MGCVPCQQKITTSTSAIHNYTVSQQAELCDYNVVEVQTLSNKLECCYQYNLMNQTVYHALKGNIQSALNASPNFCKFREELDYTKNTLLAYSSMNQVCQ